MLASAVTCYVGSNTGSPDLQGLHVLACDTETGETKLVQSVKGLQGTTYFQFDRDGRHLYSMVGDERDRTSRGKAVRFEIAADGRIGTMETLAELPCPAPCHVELSAAGRQLAYAAYGAGTAATVPSAGGTPNVVVLSDEGVGPNVKRQKKAYAHCAFYTPDGKRLGIVNLGCDRIHFFDPATMVEDKDMMIRFDPGDGPRHAIWSAGNRFLFVVNELGNSVSSFAYDPQPATRNPQSATFSFLGKWSTLPADAGAIETKASAIKLTADGKILMASNRGHDSIAFFAVGDDGRLVRRNVAKLTGKFPRDFELMPGERFVVVGHETSDTIGVYRFDRAACTLTPVGEPIPVWHPLCFKFR